MGYLEIYTLPPIQIPQEWVRDDTDGPQAWRGRRALPGALLSPCTFPCPQWARSQCTFGRQEVDKHSHGGDEDTGHDDVDDVEERLALDDEVEDDLLVLDVIWGEVLRVDDLPSGAVLDGPFTVLCIVMVPGEFHCTHGGTGAPASQSREEGEDW